MTCECGCGEKTAIAARSDSAKGWVKGQPLRFVFGHSNRGQQFPNRWKWQVCQQCGTDFHGSKRRYCTLDCAAASRRGSNNVSYRGGLSTLANGRLHVRCRDGKWIPFARVVAEATLRRSLTEDEVVHHTNGDHTDDRPENLAVISRAEHLRIHRPEWETRRKEAAARANRKVAA